MFLTFLLGFLLLLLFVIMYIFDKIRCTNIKLQKVYRWIKKLLFWNNSARYLLECYIVYTLLIVKFFKTVPSIYYFDSWFHGFQTIFICVMSVILLVWPIYATCYFNSNFKSFRKK